MDRAIFFLHRGPTGCFLNMGKIIFCGNSTSFFEILLFLEGGGLLWRWSNGLYVLTVKLEFIFYLLFRMIGCFLVYVNAVIHSTFLFLPKFVFFFFFFFCGL